MPKWNFLKQTYAPKRLSANRWTMKRVTAMTLCASIMLTSFASTLAPTRAEDDPSAASVNDLYIRQADKNTMDSYVQASLGGFIYTERDGLDAVTTPTVRNNYGTRYAGEVWADLSVFAQGQSVIGDVRPFEAGHVYSEKTVTSGGGKSTELERTLKTLAGVNWKGIVFPGETLSDSEALAKLTGILKAGALTSAQAEALNNAVNNALKNYKGSYGGDGDFNGGTGELQLNYHTDGVNSTIALSPDSDFLEVFSALGSSQVVNENVYLPVDIVVVMDTSSTMADTGTETRLYQASLALNAAFNAAMQNPYNRVALWTYDTNAELYLPLDRYEPLTVDENGDGVYFIGDPRFTSPEGGFYDPHYDSKEVPSLVRNRQIRTGKYYKTREAGGVVLKSYSYEYAYYHRSQFVQINAKSASPETNDAGEAYDVGRVPENLLSAMASVFVNYPDDAVPDPGAKTGGLTVNNIVFGEAGEFAKSTFHYTVTLSDTAISGTFGGMTFEDGVAEFDLAPNQSITASGLPVGINYEVAQPGANEWTVHYYTSTAAGGRGTISAESAAQAVFVNYGYEDEAILMPTVVSAGSDGGDIVDPTGNVVVFNTVMGAPGDSTQFTYTITLSDGDPAVLAGSYDYYTGSVADGGDGVRSGTQLDFSGGSAAVTLQSGQYIAITGLPSGLTYTVTQENEEGYTAEDQYREYSEWFAVHAGTNTHQGLYEGLNMLYEEGLYGEKETQVVINGVTQTLQRIPVVILISDGAPSYVTTSDPTAGRGSGDNIKKNDGSIFRGTIDNWWTPVNPAYQYTKTTNRQGLIGYPSSRGWGNALPIYFMASYMKQQLNKAYFGSSSAGYSAQIITVGVDSAATGDYREVGLMNATLNPTQWLDYYQRSVDVHNKYIAMYYDQFEGDDCLLWDSGTPKVDSRKSYGNTTAPQDPETIYSDVKMLYEFVDAYLKGEDISGIHLTIDEWSQYATMARAAGDVEQTILSAGWDGIKYNDRYVDTDAGALRAELQSIIESLRFTGQIFNPISGLNASGVEDSLTYTNPIGEYLVVDDVTNITMFGSQYKVEKYGVYDYQANYAIRDAKAGGAENNQYITEGWYNGTEFISANLPFSAPDGEGGQSVTYTDAAAAWKAGYVHRITYETAKSSIVTLTNAEIQDADTLPNKMKNTVYTIYAITGEYGKKPGSTYDIDPSALTPVSGNTTRTNYSYVDENGIPTETFDLLEHIKIWVEVTGDYEDDSEGDTVVDADYNEALFVNINTRALPVQVATVDKDPDVGGITYTTNLNNTRASTPLRVYFEVSFDPNYLRYANEKAAEDLDKSQAVGVAVSDMDVAYLEENTKTGYTINGVKSDDRYVAFYSNYFSDSTYEGYPVVTDTNKTSRGNPVVTFSPSLANQFYLFQKNRVLFLIPGTYDLADRPSEIDLGDLSRDVWIGNKGTANEGDVLYEADEAKVPAGYHACDPTYYEDLLAVLNGARATSGAGGAPSTYWRFGDCMPIDGGDDILLTDLAQTYRERGGTPDDTDPLWRSFTGSLRKKLDQEVYQPQIASENWYYIIRDFYYPVFDTEDNDKTENVEVHYMAIARKGSEFGSGLANNSGMGAMIVWYNPKTGAVSDTFKDKKDAGHYGYPGDIGQTDDNGVHKHDGDWYIAAKIHGLRVGGMANFAGVKGYDIRSGVGDGTVGNKVSETIAAANSTETAKTYFLPAVSSYTPSNTSGTGNTDVVINLFLGNNGRILVEETLLLVTKRVQSVERVEGTQDRYKLKYDLENQEKFQYAVTITEVKNGVQDGFTGDRYAARVLWDDEAGTWRRIVATISADTNNDGLLEKTKKRSADGDTARTVRIRDGSRVVDAAIDSGSDLVLIQYNGQPCYIHVPDDNGGAGKAVVYEYGVDDAKKIQDGSTINFWTTVELVPVGGGASRQVEIVIASMDANAGGTNGSAITLDSACNISFTHLTEKVSFDNITHTAEFSLKSGEGLVFNGIANGASFTVVETLTNDPSEGGGPDNSPEPSESSDPDSSPEPTESGDPNDSPLLGNGETPPGGEREAPNPSPDQVGDGWRFLSVNGVTRSGASNGYSYSFDDDHYTYTVSGQTGTDEKAAHYINFTPEAAVVLKGVKTLEVTPDDGSVILEKGQFTFELYAGTAAYTDADETGTSPLPDGAEVKTKEDSGKKYVTVVNDVTGEFRGTFGFGQITFKRPGDYGYTVREFVGDEDGFVYDETEYPVTVRVVYGDVTIDEEEGGVLGETVRILKVESVTAGQEPYDDETIQFENHYYAPTELTISKSVTSGDDELFQREFSFTLELTPPPGITLADEYSCSFDDGVSGPVDKTLELTPRGDGVYEGGVTLKDGQSITIHGLPCETAYTITEVKADGEDYETFVNVNGVVSDGTVAHGTLDAGGTNVKYTNAVSLSGVFLSKTVTGVGADLTREFHFTVKITKADGTPVQDSFPCAGLPGGVLTTDEYGEAGITLLHNQVIQIENLTAGYIVTVTEDPVTGYGVTVSAAIVTDEGDTVDHDVEAEEVEHGISIVVPPTEDDQGVIISFLNEYASGNLRISKTVEGPVDREYFSFRITLSYEDGSEVDEDALNRDYEFRGNVENHGDNDSIKEDGSAITFVDGEAIVILKNGQYITILGLPADIHYEVEELEANDGYITTAQDDTGTIPKGDTAHARFTNTGNPPPETGGLSISKVVSGNGITDADRTKDFHFTVVLTPPDGVTLAEGYGYTGSQTGTMLLTDNGDGTYTGRITLKPGETITISGLPAGTAYRVTEDEAGKGGFSTSASGDKGEIEADTTKTATFTNKKTKSDPVVTPPPTSSPSVSPNPSETPDPSGSPNPSESPDTSDSPDPSNSPNPSNSPRPSDSPDTSESIKPSQSLPPDTPQTGDDGQLGLWLTLLGVSLLGLIASLLCIVKTSKPTDIE